LAVKFKSCGERSRPGASPAGRLPPEVLDQGQVTAGFAEAQAVGLKHGVVKRQGQGR